MNTLILLLLVLYCSSTIQAIYDSVAIFHMRKHKLHHLLTPSPPSRVVPKKDYDKSIFLRQPILGFNWRGI
ncbi:hypothetical protein QR680_010947 [Steinernema hermaphroditum]|uniref:Uncharacterized protein n=1 Tax=Steinernema hermaphroditum TaxID=289476 RepID=A0AA39MBH7_9BILA|nr:hypothetical protein QR680_010947 [Steinernema hermaphroditum]